MRLLGAKEFLKTVKPGTLCVEFWMSHKEDCLKIIEDFKNGVNLFEKYNGEFYIFGDNGGSMAFLEPYEDDEETIIDGHKYSCLFYYDKNIVGDAMPWCTLQLVFDSEDEWLEKIPIEQTGGGQFLGKEDIKRIIKYFLEEDGPFKDETSDSAWALKKLEEEDYKDDEIINYKGERKMNKFKEKLCELKAKLSVRSDCAEEATLLDDILKGLWDGKDGDYLIVPKRKIADGFSFEPDKHVISEIWQRTLVCTLKMRFEGIEEVMKDKELSEEMNRQLEKELLNYLNKD